MSEEDKEEKVGWSHYVILIITGICAIALGRLFGFLGIGAAVIGWFSYDYSKKKIGMLGGILIGITAGLAVYGLASVGLLLMLD